jgi:hypothetical protein
MPFGIIEAFDAASGSCRTAEARAFMLQRTMSARPAAVSRGSAAAALARRLFP